MRQQTLLCALIALCETVFAGRNVVVESLPKVPTGWRKVRGADPAKTMRLRIALEQPNLAQFEQTLYDVSTPGHPSYGKHLKQEELRSLMKPRDESTAAVLEWLESAGIPASDIENDGEWVNFKATVGKVESLLDADFAIYNHVGTDVRALRTLKYSVPEEVKSHITMIQPTTRFGQLKSQRNTISEVLYQEEAGAFVQAADIPSQDGLDPSCNSTITPACIRALYKVGDYYADESVPALFGISGFLEQYAKHDALDQFLGQFAPYAVTQNFTTVLVNGGVDNQSATISDVEANLDIQYGASLAYKTNITYYSTGGLGELVPDLDQPTQEDNQNEPYLDYLTYLLALPDSDLPQTLSTSYGEDEQSVPKTYAEKVCTMFGQLGARGVSVLFSSGDTGPGSACQTNDGKNTTRFLPIFPAACPYVTAVGGTTYIEPEAAVSFSSGGFSDLWARPSYQEAAVTEYLGILGSRWEGLYNPAGRGFPDVAAQGARFQVIDFGRVISVGGTSASAPTFSALVSLLNNARLKEGQSPLGFLNPWLYSTAAAGGAFTDIVNGGSKGCTGRDIYSGLPTPYVPYAGWNATQGWDPVTGLGTPLFDKLLEIAAPACELPQIGA